MNILDETAAALPEVTERLRDFLAPELVRPADEAAPEAEAESGSEDEGPAGVAGGVERCPSCQSLSPLLRGGAMDADGMLCEDDWHERETAEAGDAPHEPAPTAEADASALAEHPIDGAH